MTAAVLHDVLEESSVTVAAIGQGIRRGCSAVGQQLTHAPQDGDKYDTSNGSPPPAFRLVVKLADRYCNIQHRLVAYPAGVKAYFGKSAVPLEIMRSRHAEIAGRFSEKVGRDHRLRLSKLGERRQAGCRRRSAGAVMWGS